MFAATLSSANLTKSNIQVKMHVQVCLHKSPTATWLTDRQRIMPFEWRSTEAQLNIENRIKALCFRSISTWVREKERMGPVVHPPSHLPLLSLSLSLSLQWLVPVCFRQAITVLVPPSAMNTVTPQRYYYSTLLLTLFFGSTYHHRYLRDQFIQSKRRS